MTSFFETSKQWTIIILALVGIECRRAMIEPSQAIGTIRALPSPSSIRLETPLCTFVYIFICWTKFPFVGTQFHLFLYILVNSFLSLPVSTLLPGFYIDQKFEVGCEPSLDGEVKHIIILTYLQSIQPSRWSTAGLVNSINSFFLFLSMVPSHHQSWVFIKLKADKAFLYPLVSSSSLSLYSFPSQLAI